MTSSDDGLLTAAEVDVLTKRLADAADGPVGEREIEALIGWAERGMRHYLALKMILCGEARVWVEGDQVMIGETWSVH
ncbi:MAG: hypothetical protein GXY47_00755 [Acidobacteria bacterium]|nr:hypothetical protein [Acidobacteriota bacterium]